MISILEGKIESIYFLFFVLNYHSNLIKKDKINEKNCIRRYG